MENSRLNVLLADVRTTFDAVPVGGTLEPWLMGQLTITTQVLGTALELLVDSGVLRIGNDTDVRGNPWCAYWPAGVPVSTLTDAIQAEYDLIPENGDISDVDYFGAENSGELRYKIREALRAVNVISYIYTDESGTQQAWVRGQDGTTNY